MFPAAFEGRAVYFPGSGVLLEARPPLLLSEIWGAAVRRGSVSCPNTVPVSAAGEADSKQTDRQTQTRALLHV